MNEITNGFIDSLYLRFFGTAATDEERLTLGYRMESEGLSERQTTIIFVEENLANSLFHEYYIQFPISIPSIDELLVWAESEEKSEAETLQLVSLIAFDFYAVNVNNVGEELVFSSQDSFSTEENQIDPKVQVQVDNTENITYSLIETSFGVDSLLFDIDSNTGITSFKVAKDHEAPEDSNADNIYQITVVASNLLTKVDAFQNIFITVNNVNEAPIIESGQTAAYEENRIASETLMTVMATDIDSTITDYSIVSGDNEGFFAIDNQGNISLSSIGIDSAANNFEVEPNDFSLSVTAMDDEGLVSEPENISISLNNIEERTFTLVGDTQVEEGDAVNYRVILAGGDVLVGSTIVLSFLLSNGTAINPADFGDLVQVNSADQTLTLSGPFSDGDVVANVNLLTVDDRLTEASEGFSAALISAAVDGAAVSSSGTVNTTIIDNDNFTFTLVGDTQVGEGDTVNYSVVLSGADILGGSTIVLSFLLSNGTAINPADFGDLVQVNSVDQTLTLTGPFSDGDVVANVSLLTVDDSLSEASENFSAALVSATVDGATASSSGTVNTTIIDNDINIINVTDNTSAALANASFTPGTDKVIVDFGIAGGFGSYANRIDFNLSNFSEIDILSFDTNDGHFTTTSARDFFATSNAGRNYHSGTNNTTTSRSGISTFQVSDRILYLGTGVKLVSSSSDGGLRSSIQISGIPTNLSQTNFEFFATTISPF